MPSVGIEPAIPASDLFKRKLDTSNSLRPKRISPKVGKFNFIGGSEGVFSDFDDTVWSKSSIYTLCVPLGPKKDATVKLLCRKGISV